MLKNEVMAEEERHEKEKSGLEEELRRVFEIILPELKLKVEAAKDENESLNGQIAFIQMERRQKIAKLEKVHSLAIKKLKTELAEKEKQVEKQH